MVTLSLVADNHDQDILCYSNYCNNTASMLPLSAAFAEKGGSFTSTKLVFSLRTITWKTLRATPALPSASVLVRTCTLF